MQSPQNFGLRQIAIIALMLFILASIAGNNLIPVLFIAAGLYALARMYDQRSGGFGDSSESERGNYISTRDVRRARRSAPPETVATRSASAETVYRHALEAVKAAGLDPDNVKVLPVDIGMIVYRGDEAPALYRTHPVPDDVDYVQPFIQLRLPTKAMGKIRFEVSDADGQVLFVHEENHQFERGRNLITPSMRLPIHDAQAMHAPWEMRVSADGVPLAVYKFEWEEDSQQVIRRHLSEDGELSNELRSMLAENRLQRMSLDELLAQQEDEPPQQEQQRQRRG
ncbi:MAG: hypothetical protein HXY40_07870 [Chloroflexi bacterium]|nr:hypothetical protein [Chloroflexota bacterium]